MTTIKRIESGARMSEAVIYGGKLYMSGAVAEHTVGKSVYEQTKEILEYIETVLKQGGSDKTKLLKVNCWLTDISKIDEMNKAWDAWVVAGQTPARATVEAKLFAPGYDVEIMIEAAA